MNVEILGLLYRNVNHNGITQYNLIKNLIGHKLEWFFTNGDIVYKYKKDYLCLKSRYCLFVWHIQVLFYAFATQTYPLQNFLTHSLILSKLSAYTKHKLYFVVSRVQFLCNGIC